MRVLEPITGTMPGTGLGERRRRPMRQAVGKSGATSGRAKLVAIVAACAAVLVWPASGSAVSLDSGGKAALEDLGQLLKSLADEGRKPPTKLAELESVEPMIPVAAPAIRSGDVVYLWGSAYSSGGTLVVAYEKKVAAEGGYVLLQSGTVKEMTAAEFQSAPKAN